MAKKKTGKPLTTAQNLGSLIKSARDIMRKDKGLSGDLDRLPMFTWVMFLKFLDDMEQMREQEALLSGEKYHPAIEPPYRWRDWAAQDEGITGDELIAFINNDEAGRPDGTRGPGLFAYLRALQGDDGGDRRDVIANVFRGTVNRMINGYLLRDVLNRANGIRFASSNEIHTLSHLYESMLKEMRDAAGDAGEFYTPRPVVKLMVAVTNPQLGETVLDPACGTGGFLVETFDYLSKQCRTVADRETLQRHSIFGGEAKPLPYLLAQMNLLLNGLEYPQIDYGNSLRFNLKELGDRERVDIILTNPPFGGEEGKGIQGNFPEDKQTSETALLFLQLIMRKLRRRPKGGRAAVVVPDNTLFGDKTCARIKKQLLDEFNVHTIVRLPEGVFSPYTDVKTNLVFFDKAGPTKKIWYYEHPLPEGRKRYTKTNPLRYEEFETCLDWWDKRQEGEMSWRVSINEVIDREYNLDVRNPRSREVLELRPPEQLTAALVEGYEDALSLAVEVVDMLGGHSNSRTLPTIRIGDVVSPVRRRVAVQDGAEYELLGVKWWGKGVRHYDTKAGNAVAARYLYSVRENDLVINKIWARHGSSAIVPKKFDGRFVSGEFPTYEVDLIRVAPEWLQYLFQTRWFWHECEMKSQGTGGKNRIKPAEYESIAIPLPPRTQQAEMASFFRDLQSRVQKLLAVQQAQMGRLTALMPSVLDRAFKGELV